MVPTLRERLDPLELCDFGLVNFNTMVMVFLFHISMLNPKC